MFRRSRLLCVALLVFCAACAAHQADVQSLPSETFSGHVTTSESGAWFTPCGSAPESPKWWVTYIGTSVEQAARAKASGLLGSERTFVRWSAARTDERRVGPGGPALLVRDILEVRAPRADDCTGIAQYRLIVTKPTFVLVSLSRLRIG